jgi:hypothetical protein
MNYQYYYNNVPGQGKCRNNLIYTSLINDDKSVFVQWYHNDTEYHHGKNQVIDPDKMEEKWQRELKYLQLMRSAYPELVPRVLDIDYVHRKIYLEIDGPDFWEMANCTTENYDSVLPNWREQTLEIVKAHKSLGLYKYSMHPSSYFLVNGRLKSINYFFVYHKDEGKISIKDHQSHISIDRQQQMKQLVEGMGISWTEPQEQQLLQNLCFESFSTNYPREFIDKLKEIYHD